MESIELFDHIKFDFIRKVFIEYLNSSNIIILIRMFFKKNIRTQYFRKLNECSQDFEIVQGIRNGSPFVIPPSISGNNKKIEKYFNKHLSNLQKNISWFSQNKEELLSTLPETEKNDFIQLCQDLEID